MPTIGKRNDATTWTLVADVVWTAQKSAECVSWPVNIPRRNAGEVMHSLTAEEVQYIEEKGKQTIRAPWISIRHGRGDCKSTAVLIAAMCKAAGRRVELKFLEYDSTGGDHWAHVFAVVDGIACDPLLPYGREYPHVRALTVEI